MDIVFGNETSVTLRLKNLHCLEDVAYVVKDSISDTDEDAKVFKKLSDNDGSIDNNKDGTYDVNFTAADFGEGKLEESNTYKVFVGIKYENSTNYIEIKLDDSELEVNPGGIVG